jgi:dTDP-4-amino-4,6-dideoxygalactose transaminase
MLKLSTPNLSEAAIKAVEDVLRSGQLVHGEQGNAFEHELATYLDCDDVVLVSSGTAALHLALLALDIGAGDAVIVPDFSFPATGSAVAITGARAVTVDVCPDSYTMDTDKLALALEQWQGPQRLRAIMPVHEFGRCADMAGISALAEKFDLAVIEDAACALGSRFRGRKAGTLGTMGCFSFHPRKTLTTGEGGAIAVHDQQLARRLRRLRSHGIERSNGTMHFAEPAPNYRLTNFQAALGRHQLPNLDDWIGRRRALATHYRDALSELEGEGLLRCPQWDDDHSWQTFMIVLDEAIARDAVIQALREREIETNLGAQSLSSLGLFPNNPVQTVGSRLYQSGLALPLYEQMDCTQVDAVAAALASALHA